MFVPYPSFLCFKALQVWWHRFPIGFGLCENHFCVYDFHCRFTQRIYLACPFHRLLGFELFGHALTLRHLFYQPKKQFCCLPVNSRSACRLWADWCKTLFCAAGYTANAAVPISLWSCFLRRVKWDSVSNSRLAVYKRRPFVQIMISLKFPPNSVLDFSAIYRTDCLYHLFSKPSLWDLIIEQSSFCSKIYSKYTVSSDRGKCHFICNEGIPCRQNQSTVHRKRKMKKHKKYPWQSIKLML